MKKRVIVTLSIATLAFLLGAVFNFNNTIAGKPVTQVAALAKTFTVFSSETFLPNELKAQDVDVDGFKTVHIQIKSAVYEDFYRTLAFSVSFKKTQTQPLKSLTNFISNQNLVSLPQKSRPIKFSAPYYT